MATPRLTTLILGAGASSSWGFPSGLQLKTAIADQLASERNSKLASFVRAVGAQIGPTVPEELGRALRHSSDESIDAFVQVTAHRTFYTAAKLAVSVEQYSGLHGRPVTMGGDQGRSGIGLLALSDLLAADRYLGASLENRPKS